MTLIASLIYNEIIICNFCNLYRYTKKYLEEKQKEEFTILKRIEIDNSHMNENDDENYNDNNNENEESYTEA